MNSLEPIIRDEIRARGPMRFDRFMELALYHPAHGYYAKPRALGRSGDYITSVSVGPLFGGLLARQARQMATLLDESTFWIVEQGAHDGQLACDILEECRRTPDFIQKLRYLIVEPSAAARETQKHMLAGFGDRVRWLDRLEGWNGEKPAGLFLSNELVDALPVRLIERTATVWTERCVAIGNENALEWHSAEIKDEELLGAMAESPLPILAGYRTEISLAARRWMDGVAGFLRRGYLLTLDYGFPASTYYASFRREGTLTCYRRHRRGDEVLSAPGEQDITAHVDFTALARRGRLAEWEALGLVDQQRFLTGIAHDELAGESVYANSIREQTRAWQMLTHPEHLGTRFQALLQAKNAPGKLDGMRFARSGGLD